jgi:hypothetical protein
LSATACFPSERHCAEERWQVPFVTVFDGNYKSSSGSLDTGDNLVIATYGNSSHCNGLTSFGGAGTSFAVAIREATTLLQNDARKGAARYLVLLSDGDANSLAKMPSNYSITDPSTAAIYTAGNDERHQAIAASRIAQNAGITVVILGYGLSSSGCDTDSGSNAISTCDEMKTMASAGNGTNARRSSSIRTPRRTAATASAHRQPTRPLPVSTRCSNRWQTSSSAATAPRPAPPAACPT